MRRVLAAALAILPLLTGCGNATSIDTRALVVGIAVDKGQKAGELRYTFQVPSPQALGGGGGGSGSGGNKFYYPTAEAPSLASAISLVEDRTSRDIYLGQLKIVLLALDLPPAQRDEFLREEQRLGEVDHTEWFAFTKPSAATVLSPPPNQEQLPSLYYSVHFNCRACQSTSMGVEAWKLDRDQMEPGHSASLPIIDITDGQYSIATLGTYNPGQATVVFNVSESAYIMLALGEMHKGVIEPTTPLGLAVVRSLGARTNRRGRVDSQGRVHLTLKVKMGGTIAEAPHQADRITPEISQMVSQATSDVIRTGLEEVVRKAQVHGVDPFRFGQAMYRQNPAAVSRLGSWPQAFSKAVVEVSVQVGTLRQGITV